MTYGSFNIGIDDNEKIRVRGARNNEKVILMIDIGDRFFVNISAKPAGFKQLKEELARWLKEEIGE